MKPTIYSRTVQYHETDRMGVVHHSNYIRWMEEARVDFMEQWGLSYAKIEQIGIMLPVLSTTCQYKYALRFADPFSIETQITQYNGFKLSLSYNIYHHETHQLCAIGTTSHCFTDLNMKPIRIRTAQPELHKHFLKIATAE